MRTLLFALALSALVAGPLLAGCDLFVSGKGGEGAPCRDRSDCDKGYFCFGQEPQKTCASCDLAGCGDPSDGCCVQGCTQAMDADCNQSCTDDMGCTPGDGCCPLGCDPDYDYDCVSACLCGVMDGCCAPEGPECPRGSDPDCPFCDCGPDVPTACCSTACDPGVPDPDCAFCSCGADVPTACCMDQCWYDDPDCNGKVCFECGISQDRCCPAGCDRGRDDDCQDCTGVTDCISGDTCCPAGCFADLDPFCIPECGNGVVEPGEGCESCPTNLEECNDQDPCTEDLFDSSALPPCTSPCIHLPVECSTTGDGCCPPGLGCTHAQDPDC